jgi:hypothetical protein
MRGSGAGYPAATCAKVRLYVLHAKVQDHKRVAGFNRPVTLHMTQTVQLYR